ncbi:hypothetical protein QFZ34_003229 [Phyllobacterium ifriqiyense]|uniref:Uncharacterized protein n=1 Tax=Phyllobacterium ifriqiyense TaxID=314238 RepID=A0ABU0SBC7_9HYPH|nr:hypothetical protein [Phyllobacterium ifriqiyense]MDQ0998047.1 hypothetical protein [Phyllobacterium ifriqiyense]
MRNLIGLLTGIGLTAMAGCAAMSNTQVALFQVAMQDPSYYKPFVNDCKGAYTTRFQKQNMARITGVGERQAQAVYCERAAQGLRAGRMSSDDMLSYTMGNPTPNVIRIAQGK